MNERPVIPPDVIGRALAAPTVRSSKSDAAAVHAAMRIAVDNSAAMSAWKAVGVTPPDLPTGAQIMALHFVFGSAGPRTEAMTLEEARRELHESLDKGTTCLCCGQHAKRYKRKLNSGIARWLIALARLSADGSWVHSRDAFKDTGSQRWFTEGPKARFWGLVESKGNDEDQPSKDSGYWRVTELGLAFVRGKTTVKKYAIVYNNRLERLEGEDVSIGNAVADAFDFSELMSTVASI